MLIKILKAIALHLLGDYVLQMDYIANNKGKNMYHLFVHCYLYTSVYYFLFPDMKKLFIIFLTHFVIDLFKARFHKFGELSDQLLHYCVILIICFVE